MKLLIATPAYNGNLTTDYFNAFLQSLPMFNSLGVQVSVLTSERDGLISRARNSCAMFAMENEYDKVLFIDSDIVWKPIDVEKLLTSTKHIVGGTYPYRSLPLNLVVMHEDLKDKSVKSYAAFVQKHADENFEIEVKYLPAGFLLVDTNVFRKLEKVRPAYDTFDVVTQTLTTAYDFFPIQILSDQRKYEAEDWGFCTTARENGFKIYLRADVIVDHVGAHRFSVR